MYTYVGRGMHDKEKTWRQEGGKIDQGVDWIFSWVVVGRVGLNLERW
jgi:hypothetical protein